MEVYADLYRGIRDRADTVTWRTLIVTIKKLLGVKNTDYKKLVAALVKRTYLEKLTPEIVYALGIKEKSKSYENLDLLLVNGRHYPEPLIWNLADYAKGRGKKVAVVNPVGHYNDGQTRVVGPMVLFRKVKKLIILASTQTKFGGSISVLSNVLRLIRNPKLAPKIGSVDVVIPMYGGSRGHRINQAEEVGFEVMEAAFNAKLLSLPAKDLLLKLDKETGKTPKIRFLSVDIHNSEYPAKVFKEEGFEFISIDSTPEMTKAAAEIIKAKKLGSAIIRVVACDKGAVPRSESLAKGLLNCLGTGKKLEIVYFDKKRIQAGMVASLKLERIEKWTKGKARLEKQEIKIPTRPVVQKTVLVYMDDMIDTGGTAEKDIRFLETIYPNALLKIFIATHPVLSKGLGALKRVGAVVYLLGNTLNVPGLNKIKGVQVVDLAPAIYRQAVV